MRSLADGMCLTLLSPVWPDLVSLRRVWDAELAKAGMETAAAAPDTDPPGLESFGALTIDDVDQAAASRFKPDASAANASSICVLAEFDGRRAVLTGDAHADVVSNSLARMQENGARIKIDAWKFSHHGSQGTHSIDVMQRITCGRFLISTDGSRHKHPHIESIARTLVQASVGSELFCNYRSQETERWDVADLKRRYRYEIRLPPESEQGTMGIAL